MLRKRNRQYDVRSAFRQMPPPRWGSALILAIITVTVFAGLDDARSVLPLGAQSRYATTSHPFAAGAPFNVRLKRPATTVARRGTAEVLSGLASSVGADVYDFGFPIYDNVDAHTPRVAVTCTEPWGTCDLASHAVPIPAGATPAPGSDGSLEIIDPVRGLLYSFWQAHRSSAGAWTTSWGTIESINGPGNRTISGRPANTGSGISAVAGVVTLADLASGRIDHALSFSSRLTCSTFVAPATKSDGHTPGPRCLPEGSRLQLDPAVNLSAIAGITPFELMVGRALQSYGAICKDTGGAGMAFAFQEPSEDRNPYPALGVPYDYWNMPRLPWTSVQLVTG